MKLESQIRQVIGDGCKKEFLIEEFSNSQKALYKHPIFSRSTIENIVLDMIKNGSIIQDSSGNLTIF